MHKGHARTVKVRPDRLTRLTARNLQLSVMRNAEAVENHPGSVLAVERVEMNTGNFISHKIMALFQRVLNAGAPEHLGIILAGLQST